MRSEAWLRWSWSPHCYQRQVRTYVTVTESTYATVTATESTYVTDDESAYVTITESTCVRVCVVGSESVFSVHVGGSVVKYV